MPPAIFTGGADGATVGVTGVQQFAVPSTVRAGDAELAILGMTAGTFHVNAALGTPGWAELAELEVANGTIIVARRIVQDDDPATIEIDLSANPGFVLSTLLA